MRVLMTGATGVIGRRAVPGLVRAGHDVTGVSRSDEGAAWLRSIGATAIPVDLFDAEAVGTAVAGIDVVVHFATAIPAPDRITKRASWETNDRLRAEATGVLVDAAIASGASRFLLESITFPYADGGDGWLDEDAPIDPPWVVTESALTAERHLERFAAAGGTAVTLRFSRLYGPGKVSGGYLAGIRHRKIPLVGSGDNYVSSIHVDDAGSAVVAAMGAPAGIYNVSDDDPVTAAEDSAVLVRALEAPAPRRVPKWLARVVVGGASNLLTVSQRVDHGRFTAATGWKPSVRSVREGWPEVVAAVAID